MKVNVVAISGKLDDPELFVYSRTGKKYRLYYVKVSDQIVLPVITKENVYIPTSNEVIIFGKIINLYEKIAIWGIDFRSKLV